MTRIEKRIYCMVMIAAVTLATLIVSIGWVGSFVTVEAAETNKFASGDGSEENPFVISNAEQLNRVRENLSAYYVLNNDIDLSEYSNWNPIGDVESPFRGYFDGDGFNIKNLTIDSETLIYAGLFGCCKDSMIMNVNLIDASIKVDKQSTDYKSSWGGNVYVGGIAGAAKNVIHCTVDGEVSVINCNNAYVGGVVGTGTNPNYCTNYANIYVLSNRDGRYNNDGTVHCGGIVGHPGAVYGNVIRCKNYGNVDAISGDFLYCGGISGEYGSINKCVNYGNISGKITSNNSWSSFAGKCNVGGIVGATSGETNNSVNYGDISSYSFMVTSSFAGGIAGFNGFYDSGTINNCINLSKNITAKGQSRQDGEYVDVDTNAKRIVAGIGTYNSTPIIDCYSLESTLINGQLASEDVSTTFVNGESIVESNAEERVLNITKKKIEKETLSIDDVWGFSNSDVSSAGLELKHYMKFFIPGYANLLYSADNGKGGLCAGMVTSSISISGYDSPPASSFKLSDGKQASKLHDVKSENSKSEASVLAMTTAGDYVRYGYVYQKTPLALLEKSNNKNNLSKLYNAVKSSVEYGNGYIEVSVRGEFHNKDEGHALLAMGIGEDNSSQTEIYVYDCNIPNELQVLYLYKKSGSFVSWSYDPGYLKWGSGRKYAEISYTTSGNDFAKDMFSNVIDSSTLMNYKFFVSMRDNHVVLHMGNNEYNLDQMQDVEKNILPVKDDSVLLDSDTANNFEMNSYWIDKLNEFIFENGDDKNTISTTNGNKAVNVDLPENAELKLSVSDDSKSYAGIEKIGTDKEYSIEYIFYSGDGEDSVKISGITSNSVSTIENDKALEVSGVDTINVDANIDGQSYTQKNVDTDGKDILIEQSIENGITISKDTDGDGTYETTIAGNGNKQYIITYNLNGGQVTGNPTTYTKDTETFTLKNPIQAGYTFIGWTGSNGNTLQKTVTIKKGTTGDLSYVANWKLISSSENSDGNSGTGTNTSNGNRTDSSKISIATAKATLQKTSYVYDGKKKQPAVTVKNGCIKLINGTHYKISYKNNKSIGTASVTITGIGNYNGSITKTFKIVPKSTSLLKLTAKKKSFSVEWKEQVKFTTGYQVQYSTSKKFMKKTTKSKIFAKNKTTKLTVSRLKGMKKYYIRIRTYKTIKGKKYYSSWSKIKAVTTKK